MNKIIIASFIFPERLDWFLDYLKNKFGIEKDNIFIFKNLDDESKYIVTFKYKLQGKRINLKSLFPGATPIHKKGMALYTINALNRLIDLDNESIGNIKHEEYQIDWDKYQNNLILLDNGVLVISKIIRIFP